MKKLLLCAGLALLLAVPAGAANAATTVPGHSPDKSRIDSNTNGYPDVGVTVVGHYYSVYAYDANGDYYWDLGDGRVQGTVGSVGALEAKTRTVCRYVVNYRGTFEDNPFMDSGVIFNHIRCRGYDDNGVYQYQIVHETDPRYRGIAAWSIWGSWEYHVLTVSGEGNLVRPIAHVG